MHFEVEVEGTEKDIEEEEENCRFFVVDRDKLKDGVDLKLRLRQIFLVGAEIENNRLEN